MNFVALFAAVVIAGGENAVYSPDGQKAAFQKLRGGSYDVGVVDMKSGKVEWISEGEGNAIFPAWTSDGGLVYVYGNDTNTAYSAMKSQSKDGYNLYYYVHGRTTQLTHGRWRDSTPFVTPDGDIYFTRSEGGFLSDHALLWKMPLNKPTDAKCIRGASFASGAGVNQPSVSPDGRYLVWAEIYGGNWDAWNIRIARVDDPEADRVLIPLRQTAFEPRWCPDSRTVIYTGFEEGDPGWGVYLMDVKTKCYRRICNGRGGVVSPDGTRLMYSADGELRERRLTRDDYPREGRDKKFADSNPSAEPGRILLSGGPVDKATAVPFAGPDFGRDKTFYCRVKVRFNGAKFQQDFINVDFGDWGNLAFRIFCSDGVPHLTTMFSKTEWIPMFGPKRLEAGEYTLTGIRGGDGRLYFSLDDAYPILRPMTQYYVPLDKPKRVLLARNLYTDAKWHTALDGTNGRSVDGEQGGASQVLSWEVGSGWPKEVPRLFAVIADDLEQPVSANAVHVRGKILECVKYERLHPRFAKAFEFMRRPDLAELPCGRYDIDGSNCWAIVSEASLKPFADENQYEVHREFIDIHAPISGCETIGVAEPNLDVFDGFNVEKDYVLFAAKGEPWTLKPGEFAVFFPEKGAHAPGLSSDGPRKIRKLVVKVRGKQRDFL